MLTFSLMALIIFFLSITLLIEAKFQPNSDHFFDKVNSNSLRGFWCLIVILVHIPAAYQNRIQDMLGSFAYVGVTFFFMTSGFGLKLGQNKNPASIKTFWRRRLPKLLVPCVLVNVVGVLIALFKGSSISLLSFIAINAWVRWLLVCYLIFWIVYRISDLSKSGVQQDAIICALVISFSAVVYAFREHITQTTWCPEIFGFVWGILLSRMKENFSGWMDKSWLKKCIIFCFVAGTLGVLYLKFKPIVFFGDYLLKILLGVAIITFMLALNVRLEIGNKICRFLGSISFEIYLLHGTVFRLIEYIAPNINSGIFIVISIIVTVLISVIVQKSAIVFFER